MQGKGRWLAAAFVVSGLMWWGLIEAGSAVRDLFAPPLAIAEPREEPIDALEIDVERTRITASSLPAAAVAVHNASGAPVSASVSCAFLDDGGAAVAVGVATVPAIAGGGVARQEIMASARLSRFASVQCRIAEAWRA